MYWGHLDRAAVFEEVGDAGRPPAVVTDRRELSVGTNGDRRVLASTLRRITRQVKSLIVNIFGG